jgi:hypothetical protein
MSMARRGKDDIRAAVALATSRALAAAVSLAEDPTVPPAVRVQAVSAVIRAAECHLSGGYQVETAKVNAAAKAQSPAISSGDILDLFGDT